MSSWPSGRSLARIQGWFYLITGAWPLVSGDSFQAVTGFKADFWLAQTVGLLLAVSGAVLLMAARHGRITPEIRWLAAGEAVVLGLVDLYCVHQPRTTRVYWLDAIVEAALVIGWIRASLRRRGSAGQAHNTP